MSLSWHNFYAVSVPTSSYRSRAFFDSGTGLESGKGDQRPTIKSCNTGVKAGWQAPRTCLLFVVAKRSLKVEEWFILNNLQR
jgi:hypothetical protein